MLKYALINNNKVENVIVCDSTDFVEMIKSQYQYVEFIGNDDNSKDVQMGYIWDGSTFFEDPEIVRQRQILEEKSKEELEKYIQTLKEKDPNDLMEEERRFLEEMEKGS